MSFSFIFQSSSFELSQEEDYVQPTPKPVTIEDFPMRVDHERLPKRWRYLIPIREKLSDSNFQHLCSKDEMIALLIKVASAYEGDISQLPIGQVGELVFQAFWTKEVKCQSVEEDVVQYTLDDVAEAVIGRSPQNHL